MPIPRRHAPADALAEDVYRLVFRSRRLLWTAAARCLEGRNESVFTWQVYCQLSRHGPAMQLDLAAACAQDPAGMSRVLEDMEARRLVRRRADPGDRRRSRVEPTPVGDAWFAEISPVVARVMDEAMKALSTRQRVALRALLEELVSPLDRAPPAAVEVRPAAPKRLARGASAKPRAARASVAAARPRRAKSA